MKKPNIPGMPAWAEPIAAFMPKDGREEQERAIILELIQKEGDALIGRSCPYAHITASAMIVSPDRKKTLMAYHRVYDSWAWTGGHTEPGETDFLAVARREAEEETGITGLRPLMEGPASIEVLPVWAHVKRGRDVGSHLHLNVSYLFEADDTLPLRIAQEENSAVGWIEITQLGEKVSEPTMMPIYHRLLERANDC
ncbi:MAG: NUDIX hydrolase [Clostridia bacterium]|nr:NUDIX hydrolase [Clostridia bacterium]